MKGAEEPRLEAVSVLPKLPEPWERFLLKQPLRAKVVGVLKDGRARINLGSEKGVFKGMKLLVGRVQGPSDFDAFVRPYALAEVLAVDSATCTVEIKSRERFRGFKQDQEVSSSIPNEIIDRDSESLLSLVYW
jgi:hypothetical protein